MIGDAEVLIAGTETISEEVLQSAKNLKLISRVGIGLNSVDLLAAERLGIKVCLYARRTSAGSGRIDHWPYAVFVASRSSWQTINCMLVSGSAILAGAL